MKPVIIIGHGGHARVVLDLLHLIDAEIFGCVGLSPTLPKNMNLAANYLGDDDVALKLDSNKFLLVNGVGSAGDVTARQSIFEKFKKKSFQFATLIHPSAIIAQSSSIGEGSQIFAGAIIQTECQLGQNVMVNTGAVIDHDCQIGDHSFIAPAATLAGSVVIGSGVHVGLGASVIQNIKIGDCCTVGAGASVIKSIDSEHTVVGVPARKLN